MPKYSPRNHVPELYELRERCTHERKYFEKHPELNLFRVVNGFQVDEHDLLTVNNVF
jgi:hypothetical protein